MVKRRFSWRFILGLMLLTTAAASAQQAGSIRGMVYDRDFDAPLPAATVTIVETGVQTVGTDQGNYVFGQVPPGTYTLVFSKDGFTRQVKANVVVSEGQLAEVDAYLTGDYAEMDEFIVQDVQIGGATEAGLLELRAQAPALMDSISANLMSQAGASDAASALKLVSGATVQDGKFAVIRGLPDRYVNSQLNAVRLPTADPDKRAVELDQFPSAIIESMQVSKTFTPDQQGDASGGAVNIVLKSIPDETVFHFDVGTSYNTQTTGRDDFLTYKGGGLNFLGKDDGGRDLLANAPTTNTDAVGVTRGHAPIDYEFEFGAGASHVFDSGVKIGGLVSMFYERDSQHIENGRDDQWWIENPGEAPRPQTSQGAPDRGNPEGGDFHTSLFDITRSSQEVKWGGLAAFGVETENHALTLMYLHTHAAEDAATLAENTRGKEFYFPGYDPNDSDDPGNTTGRDASPYLRLETLKYTERTTQSLQLRGEHTLPNPDLGIDGLFKSLPPVFDWTVSKNSARLYEPDKRQFGTAWYPEDVRVFGPFVFITPAQHRQYKPSATFTLGNLQRTWKEVTEDSDQYSLNLKFPFEQWSQEEGYLKVGIFHDDVFRQYDQDSFSNFTDLNAGNPDANSYEGEFDDYWSDVFPSQDHVVGPGEIDVDYDGQQEIGAWYYMVDLPLTNWFKLIGGTRFESTDLSVAIEAEDDATWFPPGASSAVELNPGDADVDFTRDDVLPAIGFVFEPFESVTLRGSYTETVARQTFKELTPILQQEFAGADIFIGNPDLEMSSLKNYDLRVDYTPRPGSMVSASWFHKEVESPIEYVQRVAGGFTFTTAQNYPEGELTGFEFEVRQDLGQFWDPLQGLSIGGNATLIDSEVTIPDDEAARFADPAILQNMTTRDMTNTPEHLYNIYLTYEVEHTGTLMSLFYTVRGDTLVAGAGVSDGNFVPNVYATEYGTLNFTVAQKIGDYFKLKFSAKNLTNPRIEEVYRGDFGDVTKTSYRKGIDLSIGFSAEIPF